MRRQITKHVTFCHKILKKKGYFVYNESIFIFIYRFKTHKLNSICLYIYFLISEKVWCKMKLTSCPFKQIPLKVEDMKVLLFHNMIISVLNDMSIYVWSAFVIVPILFVSDLCSPDPPTCSLHFSPLKACALCPCVPALWILLYLVPMLVFLAIVDALVFVILLSMIPMVLVLVMSFLALNNDSWGHWLVWIVFLGLTFSYHILYWSCLCPSLLM